MAARSRKPLPARDAGPPDRDLPPSTSPTPASPTRRPGTTTRPVAGVRGWRIWSLPGTALAYVLVIDLLAILVTAATVTAWHPTAGHVATLGLLAVCAATHVEVSRRV